jgi:ABC-type Mn2+/Zn2+ transport system permease subunit
MLGTDLISLTLYSVAILSGVLVGTISPALIISRSITFGLTLLHSVLAGSLLGIFISEVRGLPIPPLLTATLFTIAVSIITAEAIERGLPEDAAISTSVGVSTTVTIIIGYLISRMSPLGVSVAMGYVFGSSAIVTLTDLARIASAIIIVAPITHIFWSEFKYISFDPDSADVMGLNVRRYRYLFYSLIAVAATTLSSTVGVLMTHVIIALPGIIAIKSRTTKYHTISYAVAVSIMILGYLISKILNIPPSGGVGIVSISALSLFGVIKLAAGRIK